MACWIQGVQLEETDTFERQTAYISDEELEDSMGSDEGQKWMQSSHFGFVAHVFCATAYPYLDIVRLSRFHNPRHGSGLVLACFGLLVVAC